MQVSLEDIIVQHSTSPFEPYQIEVEEEGEGLFIHLPMWQLVRLQIGDRHYVYQDGKQLFRQFLTSQLGASDITHS